MAIDGDANDDDGDANDDDGDANDDDVSDAVNG